MNEVVKLCLDLNIFCAALLASRKGRFRTASQTLVEFVKKGHCELARVELVISWGMLNRLRFVLEEKLNISAKTSDDYIEEIKICCNLSPELTLGGTRIIPLTDLEDAHVLETALAGKAHILVTRNFKDFITYNDTQVIKENEHAIHISANSKLHIAHPPLALEWLRNSVPTR